MEASLAAIDHQLFVQPRVVAVAYENAIEHGREDEETAGHLPRQQVQRLESQCGQIGRVTEPLVGETSRARVRVGEEQVRDGENGRRVGELLQIGVLRVMMLMMMLMMVMRGLG